LGAVRDVAALASGEVERNWTRLCFLLQALDVANELFDVVQVNLEQPLCSVADNSAFSLGHGTVAGAVKTVAAIVELLRSTILAFTGPLSTFRHSSLFPLLAMVDLGIYEEPPWSGTTFVFSIVLVISVGVVERSSWRILC
jgi:hypothetical protein